MAACSVRELAHYIVDKCTRDNKPISNLQLQKILYFIQLAYCRESGQLLFDEPFEAWTYGPVLPDIYREYASYGGRSIALTYDDIDTTSFSQLIGWINDGVDYLRERSPWELVRVTHAEGSPWDRACNGEQANRQPIPNEYIEQAARG